MAFDSRNLDDYVDVATRLADLKEVYPEASLRPLDPAEPWSMVRVEGFEKNGDATTQTFIVVVAACYRTPGDPCPGVGMAWEILPGRTPYTRGSELMNAETSAWGRAILAVLASDSRRGVASREEVRNRLEERDDADGVGTGGKRAADPVASAAPRRVATAHTDPEHVRLVHEEPGGIAGAVGRVEGSQRLSAVPADDDWYDAPGQPLPDPENRAGTITKEQLGQMHAAFSVLGVKNRGPRMDLTAQIVGRKVPSSTSLSYAEGQRLLAGLHERAKSPADAS